MWMTSLWTRERCKLVFICLYETFVSAHTPPKLDSYEYSYQAWGHAPGQPALKGYSFSHAVWNYIF